MRRAAGLVPHTGERRFVLEPVDALLERAAAGRAGRDPGTVGAPSMPLEPPNGVRGIRSAFALCLFGSLAATCMVKR